MLCSAAVCMACVDNPLMGRKIARCPYKTVQKFGMRVGGE